MSSNLSNNLRTELSKIKAAHDLRNQIKNNIIFSNANQSTLHRVLPHSTSHQYRYDDHPHSVCLL
jgi:hypothetical protein